MSFATDAGYLRYQYGDADKLRIRYESHARYSTNNTPSFAEWLLAHVGASSGMTLLDAGCGPGVYHRTLTANGVRIIASDMSAGMVGATREQARDKHLDVRPLIADVQHLPFGAATFGRVMANHMLYHVPDQTAALEELRRVATPGARIVLATNAADNGARLYDLHATACRAIGLTPSAMATDSFTLEHLPLVRSVLPSAQVFLREDAFAFPDADAAIRYYASAGIDQIDDPPADGSHRARLLVDVAAAINDIIATEGRLLVPKNAGCFVGDV